jgi:hypothetical protein
MEAGITKYVRHLTKSEQRSLRCELSREKKRFSAILSRGVQAFCLVILPLWALSVFVLPAQWTLLTLFWFAFAVIVCGSAYYSEKRRLGNIVRQLEEAVALNQAHVTKIQSLEFVEIEEQDDEGPTYAFQLPGNKIVFVSNQDFPTAKFPNSEFSLVEIRDNAGKLVHWVVAKEGVKITPLRKISARNARHLWVPNYLDVIDGTLDELEQLLAPKPKQQKE